MEYSESESSFECGGFETFKSVTDLLPKTQRFAAKMDKINKQLQQQAESLNKQHEKLLYSVYPNAVLQTIS